MTFIHCEGKFYQPLTDAMWRGRVTVDDLASGNTEHVTPLLGRLFGDVDQRHRAAHHAMSARAIRAELNSPTRDRGRGEAHRTERAVAYGIGNSLLVHEGIVWHAIHEPKFRIRRNAIEASSPLYPELTTGSSRYIPVRRQQDRFYGRDGGETPRDCLFVSMPDMAAAIGGSAELPGILSETELHTAGCIDILDGDLFAFDMLDNAMRRIGGLAVEEFSDRIGGMDTASVALWLDIRRVLEREGPLEAATSSRPRRARGRDELEAAVRPLTRHMVAVGSAGERHHAERLGVLLDTIDDYAPSARNPTPSPSAKPSP